MHLVMYDWMPLGLFVITCYMPWLLLNVMSCTWLWACMNLDWVVDLYEGWCALNRSFTMVMVKSKNMLTWNGKPHELKMDEMENEAWRVKIIKFKTLGNICWFWSKLTKKSIVDQNQPFGLKWYFCIIFFVCTCKRYLYINWNNGLLVK